jgi:hypothetical protein
MMIIFVVIDFSPHWISQSYFWFDMWSSFFYLLTLIDVYTLLGLVFSSMALRLSAQIYVVLNHAIIFILIKVWSKEIPPNIDLLK